MDCVSFPVEILVANTVSMYSRTRGIFDFCRTAIASDFSGPNTDETGTIMYRTQKGPRGCVFLMDGRGADCKFLVTSL